MFIERIQVEEGILDGLDLEFRPGLNVLIGPRGSGKTSIIELLRFCLDVPTYTDRTRARSQQQALAVLQSGAVTVTYRIGSHKTKVKRTARNEPSLLVSDTPSIIILSQSEIETIGIDAHSQLRLLDSLGDSVGSGPSESSLLASVRSMGMEIKQFLSQLRELDEELETLGGISKQLSEIQGQQAALLKAAEGTQEQKVKLDAVATAIDAHAEALDLLDSVETGAQAMHSILEDAIATATDLLESKRVAPRTFSQLWKPLEQVTKSLTTAMRDLDNVVESAGVLRKETTSTRVELDSEARRLRQTLERAREGAGDLAQQVAGMQEKLRRQKQLQATRNKRTNALEQLRAKRDETLDRLDSIRLARFKARKTMALGLSSRLGPMLEVLVEHLGDHRQYQDEIVGMLRGSSLHYNSLAPALAASLTPRELAVAIEDNMPSVIADAAGIDVARASRIIAQGQTAGTEGILASTIDDVVSFSLLVGGEYKPSSSLSVGQRYTVILPLLLAAHNKVLVVDQPEDNLDNAFVVETVIKSLHARAKSSSQMICATHNPNIPVLGSAQWVVHLASDGRRCYVQSASHLDDPCSVEAITTVMEGGREAFERRAQFYSSPT